MGGGPKRELRSNVWSCSDLVAATMQLKAVKQEQPQMDEDFIDEDLEAEIKATSLK